MSKFATVFALTVLLAFGAFARDMDISELRTCRSAANSIESEAASLKSEGDQLDNELMGLNIRASFLDTRRMMLQNSATPSYDGQLRQTFNNDINQYSYDQSNYNQRVRSRNSRLQNLKARAEKFERDCADGEATTADIEIVCGNSSDSFCTNLK